MRFMVPTRCIVGLGTAAMLAACAAPAPPEAPYGKPIVLERRPAPPASVRRRDRPHVVASRTTGPGPCNCTVPNLPAEAPPAAPVLSEAEKELLFQRFEEQRKHASTMPAAGP